MCTHHFCFQVAGEVLRKVIGVGVVVEPRILPTIVEIVGPLFVIGADVAVNDFGLQERSEFTVIFS